MNKLEQAARQALEALEAVSTAKERGFGIEYAKGYVDPVITAMREVLEQPVSQERNSMFMEGYRIGLAEMREKCATVCEELDLDWRGLESRIDCAAAIRAIKFEGDTGFRPVSEMIAEHKQDPKKAAAIEKAKMRKATRAEKIAMSGVYEAPVEQAERVSMKECRHCGFLCKPNPDESRKWYPLEQAEQEPVLKSPLQLNNDEIIKSVKNSLNIYAFTAEALEMLIDNVKREERKALGENNGKRTMDGNSECGVTGCNADCCVIGNAQEPLIDLSKIKHEDKCRYWDDERFCDCGADSHELLKWYRKNAAPVQQAEQEPVAEIRVRALRGNESVPKIDIEWLVRPTPGFLYAAPVRTKDLTPDELFSIANKVGFDGELMKTNHDRGMPSIAEQYARAVIAADREKNK